MTWAAWAGSAALALAPVALIPVALIPVCCTTAFAAEPRVTDRLLHRTAVAQSAAAAGRASMAIGQSLDAGVARAALGFGREAAPAGNGAASAATGSGNLRLAPGPLSEDPPPPALQPPPAPPPWGARKSYLIPAAEILGSDALVNLFGRAYYGCCDFDVTSASIERNLDRSWVVDSDRFTINQIGHPYQGSMYQGFARASGLSYWEGAAYTFLGSAFWEIAGETTPPSRNDQITTGIGGSFLGEALFRMASLLLEKGGGPRFWREIGAAAISPPLGFNRLVAGERSGGIFPSHDAEVDSRLQLGFAVAAQDRPGTSGDTDRAESIVDFELDYGLPGKPGYTYRRPFDYFSFQAAVSTGVGIESVLTHGLLLGTAYEAGDTYRGLWGLYGSYDYLAPEIFRMASTALSLGTTAEWRPADAVTVQGTGLFGYGYATISTLRAIENERANSYGGAPQAIVTLRLTLGDRASVDLGARRYRVSGVSEGNRGGEDDIARADASLTWRLYRRHAVAVKYQYFRRDATFPNLGERTQTRSTVGIFYTLLGRDRFDGGQRQ